MTHQVSALAAALVAFMGFTSAPASAADSCDRTCLEGHIDKVLDALTSRDPRSLYFTADARFTENGQELIIGDGFWNTASARGSYSLYLADVEAGQAGFIGTMTENGVPVLLALRLRIEGQLISEIETLITRPALGPMDAPSPIPPAAVMLEQRGAPRVTFTQAVSRPASREDLRASADSYFTSLANNDGRNTPLFTEACLRLENGMATTRDPALPAPRSLAMENYMESMQLDCDEQQLSGVFGFVSEIRDRRFPLIDRERGVVLTFSFFDHSGRDRVVTLSDGSTMPNPVNTPTTLQIAELFKIDNGRIDQIEAVIIDVPYGMKSAVWDQ